MNVVLFDNHHRNHLLPFTYTRPQADIRIGILTIREKWEKRLGVKTSSLTESYLSKKFPLKTTEKNLLIAGTLCPTDELVEAVKSLKLGQTLVKNEEILAHCVENIPQQLNDYSGEKIEFKENTRVVSQVWDIFHQNEDELLLDFELITKGKTSQPLSKTNILIGDKQNLFIEEGATVEASVINVKNSKVYIGKNAEVMEGSLIRGSLALCEGSQLKLGAKVYDSNTIGPHSKVGGEINNVVIFGYTNKAHDGFMGNSVIGEWCNIGADTNTSNLKNDYSEVKLWSCAEQKFIKTGLQFCGLIMGDHVKCGINTMFNTGTVIGVGSNLFGSGYMPNFVPSFLWGGPKGFQEGYIDKLIAVAEKVYKRRNVVFDETEKNILLEIHNYLKNNQETRLPNLIIL